MRGQEWQPATCLMGHQLLSIIGVGKALQHKCTPQLTTLARYACALFLYGMNAGLLYMG